jgi:hypothetical protein
LLAHPEAERDHRGWGRLGDLGVIGRRAHGHRRGRRRRTAAARARRGLDERPGYRELSEDEAGVRMLIELR